VAMVFLFLIIPLKIYHEINEDYELELFLVLNGLLGFFTGIAKATALGFANLFPVDCILYLALGMSLAGVINTLIKMVILIIYGEYVS